MGIGLSKVINLLCAIAVGIREAREVGARELAAVVEQDATTRLTMSKTRISEFDCQVGVRLDCDLSISYDFVHAVHSGAELRF